MMRWFRQRALSLMLALMVSPCFALHSLDLMLGPEHIRVSECTDVKAWGRERMVKMFLDGEDFSSVRVLVASLPSDLPQVKFFRLRLGEALLAAGHKAAGVAELDALAALAEKRVGPDDAAVEARAGYALYRAGFYVKSAEHFTRCLDRARGSPDWLEWAWFCRAVDYWWLKQYDRAMADLKVIQTSYLQAAVESGKFVYGRSEFTGMRKIARAAANGQVADTIIGSSYVCPNVLPRVFMLQGDIRRRHGDPHNALLSYRTGLEVFLSCDCPLDYIQDVAWDLCRKLSATYAKLGEHAKAGAWEAFAKRGSLEAFEPFNLGEELRRAASGEPGL